MEEAESDEVSVSVREKAIGACLAYPSFELEGLHGDCHRAQEVLGFSGLLRG